jgi:peptide/nickel transport system permease protein
MIRLVGTRIVDLVVTLLAVSAAIFVVMNVLPGDPAAVILGTSAREDTLAALRAAMGLDRPAIVRYAAWIGGALTGDFGQSYTYGVPVSQLIGERLVVTVPLALLAVTISTAIAIPLGVAAAEQQDRATDYGVAAFVQVCVTLPNFWIGLLLILVFATTLGWLPAGGFPGWSAKPLGSLEALVLPAFALALPQAGILTRVTRTAVLDIMHEDFMRTAIAKGLTRSAAMWRHALPNALVPIATLLGLQFTFLVAGAVLVENVFSLPGLGRLAYQALAQRDIVVMQAVVLLLAALVIVVNFVVDLFHILHDPRLKGKG